MTDAQALPPGGTRESALGRVLALPGYVLFFLMLVFPMVIDLLYVKAALFAVLLGLTAFTSLRSGRVRIDPTIVLIALLMATAGQAFALEGLVRAAPGAAKEAQVYVLFPLVYMLLLSLTTDARILGGLQWTAIVATIAAGVYGALFVLSRLHVVPDFLWVPIFSQGQAIGLHQGYVEFNLFSLNTFPFLVPYTMAALLVPRPAAERRLRRWLWVALLVGLMVSAISGRRALWLVAALAPLVIAFLLPSFPRRPAASRQLVRVVAGAVLIVGTVTLILRSVYQYDLTRVVEYLPRAFDAARQEQLHALLRAWSDHWAFGSGLGSSAAGSLRSESVPWSYELYYVALLFQTGVVGLTLYALGVAWIVWMGVRVIRSGSPLGRFMFPSLVGLACFLIATGTNPYLARFDGLWVLFFPLAIINCWLQEQRPGGEGPLVTPNAHPTG